MSDGISDAYREMGKRKLEAQATAELAESDETFKLVFSTILKLESMIKEMYDLKFALERIRYEYITKYINQNDLQITNT